MGRLRAQRPVNPVAAGKPPRPAPSAPRWGRETARPSPPPRAAAEGATRRARSRARTRTGRAIQPGAATHRTLASARAA